MRIIATDFDGTLFKNKNIDEDTLTAIKNWQSNGNLFGIVTGRDYRFLNSEIERFNLKCDFLLCSSGSAIYDSRGNLIASSHISDKIIRQAAADPIFSKSLYLMFSGETETYLCSEFPEQVNLRKRPHVTEIQRDGIDFLTGICQISTRFTSSEEVHQCAERINEQFGQYLEAYANIDCVDITMKDVSKCTGIERLIERQGWESYEVLAIGDSYNDLPMIEHFKGFTVSTAVADIQQKATKVYESVGALIQDKLELNNKQKTNYQKSSLK